MKKLLLFLFILQTPIAAGANDQQKLIEQSQATIKDFATRLKTELQKGLQQGGPVEAIQICNLVAAELGQTISSEYGWQIGRTSLKFRNPDNAPKRWQMSVLKDFDARRLNGEDPENLVYQEVIDINGQRTFRYMQAIPTGGLCLTCHGEQITPEVSAELTRLYPQDRATGHRIGDLRGAFTITRKID